MKRIALWLASTATIVVLVFGYHTSTNKTSALGVSGRAPSPISTPAVTSPTTVPGPIANPAPSTESTPPPAATAAPTSSPSDAPTSQTSAKKTYTGAVAQTRWGPVQVEVTMAGSTITAVDVVQYPNGNPKDQQINDDALPVLVQETLDAQSASVDMVSGATVTSDGYLQSLQSALDQAGR